MSRKSSIYVHIPFCRRHCFYCNFTKYEYDYSKVKDYTDNLCSEIKMRSNKNKRINTIYFGGGSPALISNEYIEKILNEIRNCFDTRGVEEVTIEVNPEEGDYEKLKFLESVGFDRLSLGIQSFVDSDLIYLGRNHDAKSSIQSVESAIKCGFKKISIDFIIGLPVQDAKSILRNIKILENFGVSHVSAYLLENVKSFSGREKPDSDFQGEMYNFFGKQIQKVGFERYEVSSFCKNSEYSLHNLNYWEGGEYIGMGLGASGYEDGVDYTNFSDFSGYLSAIRAGRLPVAQSETNNEEKRKLFTGLRMSKGVMKQDVPSFQERIGHLVDEGLIEETEERFRVPPDYLVTLNEILNYLF